MKIKKVISFLLVLVINVSCINTNVFADSLNYTEKEIVFVLDRSGSMISKDKNNIANELVKMYIDTLDSEHTKVGLIGFNDTIVSNVELTSLDTIGNRNYLKDSVNQMPIKGSTDIGLALKEATALLDNTSDSEKIIVLLSDGETDVSSSKVRTIEQSKADEDFAINSAIEEDCKIYTIGINVTDNNYLTSISSKTNGVTYALNDTSDLYKVFEELCRDGVNENIKALDNIAINGVAENISVSIPNEYVKENSLVMVYSKPLNNIDATNLEVYRSNYYSSIKFENNEEDMINLKMSSNGRAEVYMFYNLISSLDPVMDTPQKINESEYEIAVKVFDNNTGLEIGKEYYKQLEGTIFVNTNGDIEEIPLVESEDGFDITITVDSANQNNTEIYVGVSNAEITVYSEKFALEKANNIPTLKESSITKVLLNEEEQEISLNKYFDDLDGDVLSYELLSVNGEFINNVKVVGDKLVFDTVSEGLENIEIVVTDSNGGYGKGILTLSVMPFWIYYKETSMVVGLVLIMLLLIGVVLVRKKEKNKQIATKEDEGDTYVSESKNFFKDGKLEGYFLNTKSGKEYPAMFWNENYLANKTLITLGELLVLMDVDENLMEARKIFFEATDKEEITFWHRTRCVVYVNSRLVESGKRVKIKYDDKMYIVFEDGETEIEVRYKRVRKKSLV